MLVTFHFLFSLGPEFHFEVDQFKSGTPLRGRPLSRTPFQGGLLNLEFRGRLDPEFRGEPVRKSFIGGLLPKEVDQVISNIQNSKQTEDLHLSRGFLEEFEVISFPDVYQTNFED
ncbi:hypothetical protein RclHR1_30600001 [Rhizophagus clarus]|uniref:Uncharacterized protein n=1 Tax=Rhizophagus clarus TaxID=94130 RepID=A0A2Z6R5R0_9GLOM|nr:hypothetical protein RclHR1_30600001 [Rhizophagus clarus]